MKPRVRQSALGRASKQSKIVLAIAAVFVLVGLWGHSKQKESAASDAPGAIYYPGTGISSNKDNASITGRASVIDGDTIEIRGQRIRLHGIDAPESNQICEADGRQYRCGRRAATALYEFIDGRTVECEKVSTDGYGRVAATCTVRGDDMGAHMVREGWAIAYRRYSDAYVSLERDAEAARRGLWAGTFSEPERWRGRQPASR
jgi:endonuclease YncB( thermonuclease family)